MVKLIPFESDYAQGTGGATNIRKPSDIRKPKKKSKKKGSGIRRERAIGGFQPESSSSTTWSESKIPEERKEKNYARRVLANATGKKNYKNYLGVPIPEKPSEGDINEARGILGLELKQSGGMVGKADMSAKKTSEPKKKKMPQYYKGGGMIKKNKLYAYGGRVAKYKD